MSSNANKNNSGYVNLNYVCSQVLLELEMDNRFREKILQHVINGYSKLLFEDSIKNVKTVILKVDDANVVDFPQDYIEYISIGIQIGGRTYPLALNQNILKTEDMKCGEWLRDPITSGNTNEVFDKLNVSVSHKPMTGKNLTTGGAFSSAYYKIDERNSRILFLTNSVAGLEVVLDYKALDITNDTMIPRKAVPALVAYATWRLDKRNKKIYNYDKETSKREWIIERNKLYAMTSAFTAAEFLDIRYRNTYRGLK